MAGFISWYPENLCVALYPLGFGRYNQCEKSLAVDNQSRSGHATMTPMGVPGAGVSRWLREFLSESSVGCGDHCKYHFDSIFFNVG